MQPHWPETKHGPDTQFYEQHDRLRSAIATMPGTPRIPTGAAFAIRLAVFYAAFFGALGVQTPFLPVWLAAKGLTDDRIGIALATPMLVRIVAVPLATRAADRWDALRVAIIVMATAAMLGYAVLGLASSTVQIMAALAVASAFYTPIIPLTDAYAVRGLARASFGRVRLWGSVAFIAGSFLAGALLDVLPARDLIWLIVAGMVVCVAAGSALAPASAPAGATCGPHLSEGRLLRDGGFLMVAAAASLIQASHAVYYGFSAIAWQRAGLDGLTIGMLWALGVVAEIALFAFSARLALGPHGLLLLGATGASVRWGAMALDPALAVLPLLQCLHGLSFGATYLGAIAFVARAAPPGLGATAQGYFAVASGIAMAATSAASGALYASFGDVAYAAMAITAAAGGGLAWIGARRAGAHDRRA